MSDKLKLQDIDDFKSYNFKAQLNILKVNSTHSLKPIEVIALE